MEADEKDHFLVEALCVQSGVEQPKTQLIHSKLHLENRKQIRQGGEYLNLSDPVKPTVLLIQMKIKKLSFFIFTFINFKNSMKDSLQ